MVKESPIKPDTKRPVESEIIDDKVVETFDKNEKDSSGEVVPKVKRGRIESLKIYDVSESELSMIENGPQNGIYLNFSIFLLSLALSFLTTLLTIDLSEKLILFIIFLIICVVGFIVGIFLLILWFINRKSFKKTIKMIRNRIEE
jgi:hypothetical protein